MSSHTDDWASVEAFLNAEDQKREFRRANHRLAREWYSSADVVWSITLCARHHGRPFECRPLADGVVNALRFYRDRRVWSVFAYCLMPDYLHAVLRLNEHFVESESKQPHLISSLARFKRYTTTQIAWKNGFVGKLWQREFYDHACRNLEDTEAQCRYVLENPVRNGIVSAGTDYPWAGSMDEWA